MIFIGKMKTYTALSRLVVASGKATTTFGVIAIATDAVGIEAVHLPIRVPWWINDACLVVIVDNISHAL